MLKFLVMILLMIIKKNKNMPLAMMVVMMTLALSLQTSVNAKSTYMFSSDLISFWITMMTIMIMYTLMYMKNKNSPLFKKLMMTMTLILTATFNNWNFMMFYILFEMSMIVILMIIITWGYQPERMEAIMFMIIMTLIFSLPFLAAMMTKNKTLNFWFLEINNHLLTFISFMFIFMMKMPIYFTHFWLPKVHVEAPVHGSMILAAILLKLGCYGMMRMNKMILHFQKTKPIILSASIYSMIVLSMGCLIQIDLKTLIAYSSIVHMTMVFMNILLMKTKSLFSSMAIILGHGLCAACLFFMANIMYENSKSRSTMLNKGILTTLPAMTLMWFISCMNNAPMPPSMNMLGELISFKNLLSWSSKLFTAITIAALTSSIYSIYLFCIPSHSKFSKMSNKIKLNTTKHSIMTTIMLTPIVLITAKPTMLTI